MYLSSICTKIVKAAYVNKATLTLIKNSKVPHHQARCHQERRIEMQSGVEVLKSCGRVRFCSEELRRCMKMPMSDRGTTCKANDRTLFSAR